MRKLVLNNVIKLRRKLYYELVKSYKNKKLKTSLAKFPKRFVTEKNFENKVLMFYEREIVKEHIKFILGLDYSKSEDLELFEIVPYVDTIIEGTSELLETDKFINAIEEICSECPGGKYYVTDLCRNCLAHSCMSVCPKSAISIIDNRAKIDYSKCVNCGLCSSACPYHAITKLERPCESSCAPKAISTTQERYMDILYEKCTYCGACYIACPFGAIKTPSQILQVTHKLLNNDRIIAIYAPSAVSQFGSKVTVAQFKAALKKLGFFEVFEVAEGADMVAREEAKHFAETRELMLTSCCPAFVQLVKKLFPEFSKNISPIPSPMVMLSQKILKKYPDYEIVFIGPCIAKKLEAKKNGIPHYVLTFEEIGALFAAFEIEPMLLEEESIEGPSSYGWNFASTGGVANAVKYYLKKEGFSDLAENIKIVSANGLSECMKTLKEIKSGKIQVEIFEGMACDGGCIGGPGILVDPRIAFNNLKRTFSTAEKV
ncbi:monomeric [FeFe] hydrogenase [Thermosipho atlanticus]|uniref:4Fe-4S binding domain-containing protein n=1 Tax=Thermosipho atlanticus DSM 15807 TaxID=1123380 RepID=A0A1M5RCB2_9BACT|nr:monomeric [FeFe] hydrogenase [Thermosipho atlanticus]SHH23808.1 4Fe-4S binding domain-containing protein [Thermosipho atlanticus DSM 15807]